MQAEGRDHLGEKHFKDSASCGSDVRELERWLEALGRVADVPVGEVVGEV